MLAGKRILVLEDEPLVAMMVEDLLIDLGCIVIGPAMHLPEAMQLAAAETLDGAVLDININGGRSYPVADLLAERGIPAMFATGYGYGEELKGRAEPVLQKPYQGERLAAALSAILPSE
jgi:CheY-like chemotaxis protein